MGILHDEKRSGLADHEHTVRWTQEVDGQGGGYVTIRVHLDCGCEVKDIRVFAEQMRAQRGWDIATSVGWGWSSGHGATMRVRRGSLRA